MTEAVQNWLGTRLGIVLDMSPQNFGRNTKDGKLMAKLLHNFGVIPEHVFEKINESRNFYECYNNWVALQPWLKHVGATHDSETLERIAGGEGSSAISLFYSVYLNLERHDRLRYISAQKERQFSEIKWGEKFKVDLVPESEVRDAPIEVDDILAKPLIEKRDLIEWHRKKCKEVIENINKTKKKFSEILKKNQPILEPIVPKIIISQPINQQLQEAEETKKTITAFEKKHPDKYPDLTYSELIKQQRDLETRPCLPIPNLEMAKKMMSDLKLRRKIDIYSKTYVRKNQLMVLDEEWNRIIRKQYQNFQDVVCKNLLKQSQYEKQMGNKLYQLRQQKKILAENRSIIENLKMDQEDKQYNDKLALKLEYNGEYWEEEEFRREKNLELHKRIYADKINAKKEFLKQECREIIQSIADVAIKISNIREQINCEIPKAIMKDLKELFFKNLPIFDSLANLEELYERDESLNKIHGENGDEQDIFSNDENYKLVQDRENYRQSMLDDCDFFDYQNLTGPWMVQLLFPDSDETEVQQIVLAYIVNKILENKYPIPKLPIPAPIKTKKRACVVLELEDEACKMLTDLMNLCKILVVHIEDAINFVLSVYKEETSATNLINETLRNFSRDTLRKKESRREVNKKLLLLKKEAQIREDNGEHQYEGFYTLDKETQTPKKIPQGDSPLSSNAEIGRAAFEALYFGDPIPDPTIICALLAYITAKQNDYDGWIILNYPRFYAQASDLEFALNGYRVLPEPKTSESIEEMEGFTYRHRIVNPFCFDDHIKNRTSKLVPNINTIKFKKEVPLPESPTTYFNVFLKLKKLGSQSKLETEEMNILSSMDRFYIEQKVFRVLEYSTQNFQTVKNIGKILLGNVNELGEKSSKTSLEIFGNDITELNEKWNKTKARTSMQPERKAQKTRPSELDKVENYSVAPTEIYGSYLESADTSQAEEKEVMEENYNIRQEEKKENLKPGDPDWNWAEGFQPKELLLALATLWENMEAVYIETLKDVFFSLRVHRLNVLAYCSFVKKTRRALMRRRDDKQNVLEEFQKKFNAIEEDIRVDVDVKTELYVRVAEMEEILMGMADERKKNSFNDIKEIANDSWVPNEMSSLVNSFLTAVQLEVDRCTHTCQVINDYYLSLLQKIPDEKSVDKIIVPKLLSRDKIYSYVSSASGFSKKSLKDSSPRFIEETRQSKSKADNESKKNSDKATKSRSFWDKKHKTSDTNLLNGAAESIAEILTNLSFPSGSTTPFHEFLKENVATVIHEIQTVMHNYIAEARKVDKPNLKTNRKRSRIKLSANNLNLEWVTALENELTRFLFRVKLLLVKGIFDMNEFLTTILNTFSSLNEEVKEMYCKEIQSISDCCKVFRCSIEEEMPIEYQLVLKEDEFYIDTDVFLSDKRLDHANSIKKEEQTKTFTVHQLSLLFEKLQRVAPDGEIIKRSLLFILEDLRVVNQEMKSCNCFPESWKLIEPEDMTFILNEIYQDLEIVNWKDFIIYALDLPIPSEQDILTMRNAYRTYDSLTTELINWEDFSRVCFWFESSFYFSGQGKILEKMKELLFRMYQVDENRSNYSALLLAFCKDENPIYGFTKALALATGKKITVNEIVSENSSLAEEYEIYEEEAFEESNKTTPKKRICSLTPSVEKTLKCLPKEKILRCDCGDIPQSEKTQEEDEKMSENAGENESDFYQDSLGYPYGAINVSVVPCDIVSSIIRASFPSLPQLSVLLDCKETFQETLNSIYDSLESKNGKIDIFDLIRHNFVSRLLLTTNKFKFIKIQTLFNSSYNAKNSIIQPSIGPSRLNYNYFA